MALWGPPLFRVQRTPALQSDSGHGTIGAERIQNIDYCFSKDGSICSVQPISILKGNNPESFSQRVQDGEAEPIERLGQVRAAGQLRKYGGVCFRI